MKIKNKVGLLTFVGATVLSLGLQSQQAFAAPYRSRDFNSRLYRYSPKTIERFYVCDQGKYDWYIDQGKSPESKPELEPIEPETTPEATPEEETEVTPEINSSVSAFEVKVVELTNAERARQGLPALKIDYELSKVAKLKSQDMQSRNYFDHNSPTYGSPFDMMRQFGVSYRAAGENIAKGQRSPEAVVNAWMNSEGHRKNILEIGRAHV